MACRWLTQQRGVRPEDLVLYGQSLGSGPTVDLAARCPEVAGVVLHAAFASCARPRRRPAPDMACRVWAMWREA